MSPEPDDAQAAERIRLYEGMGHGFSAALELVVGVVLGYFLGHYLDGKFGTAPWLALTLLLLGAVGGFYRLYHHAQQEDEGVPKRGSGPTRQRDVD